jgi:hypothetical protein
MTADGGTTMASPEGIEWLRKALGVHVPMLAAGAAGPPSGTTPAAAVNGTAHPPPATHAPDSVDPTGSGAAVAVGGEIELGTREFKHALKYGELKLSLLVKVSPSVTAIGDSDAMGASTTTITSKDKKGGRDTGVTRSPTRISRAWTCSTA